MFEPQAGSQKGECCLTNQAIRQQMRFPAPNPWAMQCPNGRCLLYVQHKQQLVTTVGRAARGPKGVPKALYAVAALLPVTGFGQRLQLNTESVAQSYIGPCNV